jgi:hypothetical protein
MSLEEEEQFERLLLEIEAVDPDTLNPRELAEFQDIRILGETYRDLKRTIGPDSREALASAGFTLPSLAVTTMLLAKGTQVVLNSMCDSVVKGIETEIRNEAAALVRPGQFYERAFTNEALGDLVELFERDRSHRNLFLAYCIFLRRAFGLAIHDVGHAAVQILRRLLKAFP